ncbi:MAG: signal recognition particle-docking protein FtsY [Synechococcus sp.]
MVFNWFQRNSESENAAEAPPAVESEPVSLEGAEPSAEAEQVPVPAEAPAEPAPSAPEPQPTSKEDEALAWAKAAYARLKEQQDAVAVPAPTPVVEAPPQQSQPEPQPEPAPSPEPEPAPQGLSFLEQAAAQREQRQRDLDARAVQAEPTSASAAPEALQAPASAPAQPVADAAEPQLGSFDEDFTWSAEVLAAQGRRADEVSLEEIDWLGRLRRGLEKTRQGFVAGLLENLGDDPLTPEVLDDLETLLLRADAGVTATDQVLDALRERMNQEVVDPAEGIRFLKEQLRGLLEAPINASGVDLLGPQRGRLNIWLMVGVNGVGKTTTLGKLANLAVRSGYSALIAAADTFRAAAVQQVEVWGERSAVDVISNPTNNADPAAVVFDAVGAARSRQTNLLLVDTAGRLQTKHNLMEELQKVRKIIDRLAPEAHVESLLVLDASQGQNGLRQAMAFADAAQLTGVVITKLDGTARGGVALAVASEAGLPIRFIGAGEGIRDLRPFNSFEFVEALLAGR